MSEEKEQGKEEMRKAAMEFAARAFAASPGAMERRHSGVRAGRMLAEEAETIYRFLSGGSEEKP